MFDVKVIDRIAAMSKENEIIERDGCEYSVKVLNAIKPPMLETVKVSTLTSIVEYCKFTEETNELFCNILSPTKVNVYVKAIDDWGRYHMPISADCLNQMPDFNFGQWYDQQTFIIEMQTSFFSEPMRAKVLDIVSNISVQAESDVEDDGITQRVSAKSGTHLKKMVEIENPLELEPFASFPEIAPMGQPYILRVQKNRHGAPEIALFNSGSAVYRADLMRAIKIWLTKELPDMAVI